MIMHVHVDWGYRLLTTNRHEAEYDASLYYCVIVGIPVYASFKQCLHIIAASSRTPKDRAERMARFAENYLDNREINGKLPVNEAAIPLNPSWSLRWRTSQWALLPLATIPLAIALLNHTRRRGAHRPSGGLVASCSK